jgi:hypothetical protein
MNGRQPLVNDDLTAEPQDCGRDEKCNVMPLTQKNR